MKTVFLSDLHLGARYIPDARAHELKICRFLREKCSDADEIYLLGDVLDYWFEYKHVVPRGFVRFFGTLAELTDRGVKINWLTGNHDIWLFDYLSNELGVNVIDERFIRRDIGGKRFILTHGDRLGSEPKSFRLISKAFRNKFLQKAYSAIHPRWTVPFALRWSSNSRYSHNITDSDEEQFRDFILKNAEEFIERQGPADFLIMGHHHIAMDEMLAKSHCRLIVLGDWIERFTYAVYDGNELELIREK